MDTRSTKPLVYVAMSGGVDSSVAAGLLKKDGFRVVGVFMKPWSHDTQSGNDLCMWKEDRQDALKAATALDIPFYTWDFSEEYKKEVAQYMVEEYRVGRTPNPDVACNKEIKFGLFLNKALSEGADYIATGHYARIAKVKNLFSKKETFKLLAGKDKNKDQSYFLWTLTQDQLSKIIFPIGNLKKPQVRQLAKNFKLPNAQKKDSQGVCFIGPLDMKAFLKEEISPQKGNILDVSGQVIGEHDGVWYYTIGQRHGLDIKNGRGPYYVVSKDITANTITVGSEKDLESSLASLRELHWIRPLSLPRKMQGRIRYRGEIANLFVSQDLKVKFSKAQRAIAPGQSIVFYRNEEVLGGGIIS